MASLNQNPHTSIRINPFKISSKPALEPVNWSDNGFYVPHNSVFAADPLWHAGAYYVQEASSMFLEKILSKFLPEYQNPLVLDLCAAPGGKSTLISTLLAQNGGFLVANEVISSRLGSLRENLTKWGLPNFWVTNRDAAFWGKQTALFDVMVVDAPCSGEGMFRKDPQSRSQWNEDSPAFCANRQKRILEDALPALREGGLLVYSTCTFNQNENEAILTFLEQNGVEWLQIEIPESGTTKRQNGFAFYPHKVKGEGFFIAVGRKTKGEQFSNVTNRISLPKPISFDLGGLELKEPWFGCNFNDKVLLFNNDSEAHYNKLSSVASIDNFGFHWAEIKGKDYIPLPLAAYAKTYVAPDFNTTEIDYQAALKLLRKEDPGHTLPRGFHLLSYKKVPLGWIKSIGNRNNNLYPSNFRLIKSGFEEEVFLLDLLYS